MTAHATIAPSPIDNALLAIMADLKKRSPVNSTSFQRSLLLQELLAERGLVIVSRTDLRARDRIRLATGALFGDRS